MINKIEHQNFDFSKLSEDQKYRLIKQYLLTEVEKTKSQNLLIRQFISSSLSAGIKFSTFENNYMNSPAFSNFVNRLSEDLFEKGKLNSINNLLLTATAVVKGFVQASAKSIDSFA